MCRVSPGIFFFVPENNVNLQSILMGRGIGHTQFEAVYTQYYARFVIIARRYVRDVAVAEDIGWRASAHSMPATLSGSSVGRRTMLGRRNNVRLRR